MLAQKRCRARHIRRSHTRTAVRIVPAGNSAHYLSAVRRDLGFELKIGSDAPAAERRHERSGSKLFAESDLTDRTYGIVYHSRTLIESYRTCGNGVFYLGERHSDLAREIVINYDACGIRIHGVLNFFGERNIAAANKRKRFTVGKRAAHGRIILRTATYPAYYHIVKREISVFIPNSAIVFPFVCGVFFDYFVYEFDIVGIDIRGIYNESNAFFTRFTLIGNKVRRTFAVYTRNRQRRTVSGRRTDGSRVGICGKVHTVSAAVAGTRIVTRRNDQAYTEFAHRLVDL